MPDPEEPTTEPMVDPADPTTFPQEPGSDSRIDPSSQPDQDPTTEELPEQEPVLPDVFEDDET